MPESRFPLGRTLITPGAEAAFEESGDAPFTFLARHSNGDWGDCGEEDAAENEFAVDKELRIFSVYKLSDDTKIWVITEADRSATTILLPSEY